MDISKLIEHIRKEYILIQNEKIEINKLNQEINENVDSILKLTWIIRHQRYMCDKLNINGNEQINIIDELNKMKNVEFLECHKKFHSNEMFLSQIFNYLKNNPKTISYLLFYSEKECINFSDLLCKIVISSIYSHCYIPQDKVAIVDIMEELIEIYINFHDDVRRQIHSKRSSFCMIYRYYCDELFELKTFFKLVLYEPIMSVLSEDNLFLDVDSDRAAMRFYHKEREKHFGNENTKEYKENLIKYKKWTINKLKYFVSNFITSLRNNIFSFPQSLAMLIIRLYSKLINHLEFKKVYSICIDMIFCFLICPAIQNPDLFGITNLHINHIAQYNLMQCAQIIQMLALSKWEKVSLPFQEVCDLFDKDCLAFVIDHILGIFSETLDPKPAHTSCQPYFLISETELTLFLKYLRVFLENNNQDDNPLKHYFNKLPESVFNFEFENKNIKNDIARGTPLENKKSKSIDIITNVPDYLTFNVQNILTRNDGNIFTSIFMLTSKNVFQISNVDFVSHSIGMLSEKKLLESYKISYENFQENFDKICKEIDEIIKPKIKHIDKILNSTGDIQSNHFYLKNNLLNEMSFLKNDADKKNVEEKLINFDEFKADYSLNLDDSLPVDKINSGQKFKSEIINMQSLGTLSLDFKEMIEENDEALIQDQNKLSTSNIEKNLDNLDILLEDMKKSSQNDHFVDFSTKIVSNSMDKQFQDKCNDNSITNNSNIHKKGFFTLSNFKSIKDKMKNISLKDNKLRTNAIGSNSFENLNQYSLMQNLEKDQKDLEVVRAKTTEILDKYRSKNSNDLISISTDEQDNLDETDVRITQPIDYLTDIKNKLRKLMSIVDLSLIYQNYTFLNLQLKNDFSMFLKVILSKSHHMDAISHFVLITDIIRIIESIDQKDFLSIFQKIESEIKTENIYMIYLLKSKQNLWQNINEIRSAQLFLQKEEYITNFIIVSFLVRRIIEKKDANIQQLLNKFNDPSIMPDEKASLVDKCFIDISDNLESNVLNCDQQLLAKHIIDRHLMSRIYLYAFYPNGDIDKLRDQLLHQQISRLSQTITHSSKLLKIPTKYFTTSPWPSAQAELLLLSAYKAPRDKVQCIYRCCSHIITLLSTSENTIPSADDLLPVLIFVVIKANPMSILSTIQYVNTFYYKELAGEEAYYWTQFCSVVEFIKTILNQQ